jgi:hypothetical protein
MKGGAGTGAGGTGATERGGFGPCSADVQRLCGEVRPGQGRVFRCLRAKEAEVSPACKAHVRQRREEFREARAACAPDVQRFCKDVRPGQGRVVACLKAHQADLAPACKQELAE